MSIFNRHTPYEQLVTEYVDGVLNPAGEVKLRKHLETCKVCAAEVQEQREVRKVLRTQPMVAAPRSFALPYAPQPERATGARLTGLLRTMQVATASAAMVLLAVVGLSITGGPLTNTGTPPGGETVAFTSPSPTPNLSTAEGMADDPKNLLANPPNQESVTRDSAEEPGDARTSADDDTPPSAAQTPGRSPLEWALISSSALTALLALGVVAVSWRGRQAAYR